MIGKFAVVGPLADRLIVVETLSVIITTFERDKMSVVSRALDG